jgi:hypothetical protein
MHASGIAYRLEIAQHRNRHAVGAAQFDDLAETAAVSADPARPLATLATAEQYRCHRLGRLDRDRAYAGWKRGHIEPILARPRTGPAAMEDRRAERLECRATPSPPLRTRRPKSCF